MPPARTPPSAARVRLSYVPWVARTRREQTPASADRTSAVVPPVRLSVTAWRVARHRSRQRWSGRRLPGRGPLHGRASPHGPSAWPRPRRPSELAPVLWPAARAPVRKDRSRPPLFPPAQCMIVSRNLPQYLSPGRRRQQVLAEGILCHELPQLIQGLTCAISSSRNIGRSRRAAVMTP